MNKNNKEVELRYRVKNKKRLLDWLKKNTKKLYEYHQIDEYFTPAHENYFDKNIPDKYLRIRQSGDKSSVTFKLWHGRGKNKEDSHCDEYETDVADGEQMRKIFKLLGFKTLVIVDKHRTSFQFENFEIEVDEVADVGVVCELELKEGYKSIKEAYEMIKKLAGDLGFSEKDRTDDLKLGYALLIAKKKGPGNRLKEIRK